MRGEEDPVAVRRGQVHERVVRLHGLGRQGVDPCPRDLAAGDGRCQCLVVHDLAAGCVDQPGGVFHCLKESLIRHARRLFRDRHVQADDVALCEQFVERQIGGVAERFLFRGGLVTCIVHDPAVERSQPLRRLLCDRAEADETHRAVAELRKALDHHALLDLDLPALAHRPVALARIAQARQHQKDRLLRNRRRIGALAVADIDAALRRLPPGEAVERHAFGVDHFQVRHLPDQRRRDTRDRIRNDVVRVAACCQDLLQRSIHRDIDLLRRVRERRVRIVGLIAHPAA